MRRRLRSAFTGTLLVTSMMGCNAIVGTEDIDYYDDAEGIPDAGVDADRDAPTDGGMDEESVDADEEPFSIEDAPTDEGFDVTTGDEDGGFNGGSDAGSGGG